MEIPTIKSSKKSNEVTPIELSIMTPEEKLRFFNHGEIPLYVLRARKKNSYYADSQPSTPQSEGLPNKQSEENKKKNKIREFFKDVAIKVLVGVIAGIIVGVIIYIIKEHFSNKIVL